MNKKFDTAPKTKQELTQWEDAIKAALGEKWKSYCSFSSSKHCDIIFRLEEYDIEIALIAVWGFDGKVRTLHAWRCVAFLNGAEAFIALSDTINDALTQIEIKLHDASTTLKQCISELFNTRKLIATNGDPSEDDWMRKARAAGWTPPSR